MNRLSELRKERHLTLKDMAKYLDVSVGSYNYYELGKTEPDIEKLKKLADFFCVSIDYLLGYTVNNVLTNVNKEIVNNNSFITEEEKKLLTQFRCLGKAEKHAVALSCETFYKNSIKKDMAKEYKENKL